eukprot:GHVR01083216.1.p1 GENE.GHVR01083216.1~~GHVR01083216.1.p1  ORF type:complete len:140 (+),score=15.91 GHVR01083216.1:1188-1607(+)
MFCKPKREAIYQSLCRERRENIRTDGTWQDMWDHQRPRMVQNVCPLQTLSNLLRQLCEDNYAKLRKYIKTGKKYSNAVIVQQVIGTLKDGLLKADYDEDGKHFKWFQQFLQMNVTNTLFQSHTHTYSFTPTFFLLCYIY